jgi:hypothetical protein
MMPVGVYLSDPAPKFFPECASNDGGLNFSPDRTEAELGASQFCLFALRRPLSDSLRDAL